MQLWHPDDGRARGNVAVRTASGMDATSGCPASSELTQHRERWLVHGGTRADPSGKRHRHRSANGPVQPDEQTARKGDVEDALREGPPERRRSGGAEKT